MTNHDTLLKFMSIQGYKKNSPDKDRPFNLIPSGNITMKNVPHYVYGIDDLGNEKMMAPGEDYTFPGNSVFEIPIKQLGGDLSRQYRGVELMYKDYLQQQKDEEELNTRGTIKTPRSIKYRKAAPVAEEVRTHVPQSTASKTWEVLTHPTTAAGYAVRHEDLPDNFSKGELNAHEQAVNIVNPFFYTDEAKNLGVNVYNGNLKEAGHNALNLLPLASEYKAISKGVTKAGNYLSEKAFGEKIPQRIVYDLYGEPMAATPPQSLKDELLYKLNKLNYNIGDKVRPPKTAADLEDIITSANLKLQKGLGIKKIDAPITLQTDKTAKGFVDVFIADKKAGEISLSPLREAPTSFTNLIRGKVNKYLVKTNDLNSNSFMNAPKLGYAKEADNPFSYLKNGEQDLVKGKGFSGEINTAISDALKERDQRLYSGATGHSDEGMMRYLNLRAQGVVDEITPKGFGDPIYIYKQDGGNINNNIMNYKRQDGGQQDQLMQIIQAYAQMTQMDPQELMQKLQQLPPEQQQAALQQMAQQVQQGGDNQQAEMQYGGLANNGFNRTMIGANNITDPDYGVIPYLGMMDNDFSATLGIIGGAASALSGSALGYSSLFNKKKPKGTSAFMEDPNITNKQQFNLSNPNDYFKAFQNPYWKKYGKAQYGLELSDLNPYGYFDDPRFGQNTDYGNTTGMKPSLATPSIQPNSSAPGGNKTHNGTINISGPEIGTNAMIGLGLVNTGLEHFEDRRRMSEYKRRMAALGNTDSMNAYNSPNAFGEYTTNAAAGTDNFRPNMHAPIQDFGTNFYAKNGGQKKLYKAGGEYSVSEDELLDLMQRGVDIEFL